MDEKYAKLAKENLNTKQKQAQRINTSDDVIILKQLHPLTTRFEKQRP